MLQVTHKRLCATMEKLANPQARQACAGAGLVNVAFGVRPPRMITNPPAWTPRNGGLDASQVRVCT